MPVAVTWSGALATLIELMGQPVSVSVETLAGSELIELATFSGKLESGDAADPGDEDMVFLVGGRSTFTLARRLFAGAYQEAWGVRFDFGAVAIAITDLERDPFMALGPPDAAG